MPLNTETKLKKEEYPEYDTKLHLIGLNSGDLWSVEYLFITIIPRSTLTWIGNIC